MSPIRKLKAALNFYPGSQGKPENFYQFALDHKKVIGHFTALGFEVQEIRPKSGWSGFEKELPRISLFIKTLTKGRFLSKIDGLLSRFSGHAVLIVLRKV
jgi:hypothetical protein